MKTFLIFLSIILFSKFCYSQNNYFVEETFSKENWQYILPHKFDSSSISSKILNGNLVVTLQPGTYGWSGDEKHKKERAEFGKRVHGGFNALNKDKLFFMQFDARVDKGFKALKRTMIAQIKTEDKSSGSPAAAIYLDRKGGAKCMDYNGSDERNKHKTYHNLIYYKTNIDATDGNWHTFKIILKIHDTEGYCKILIDNKPVVEISNVDTKDKSSNTVLGRIGIYRDKLPHPQTVYFDNWIIDYN